jgi:hypothetical protein
MDQNKESLCQSAFFNTLKVINYIVQSLRPAIRLPILVKNPPSNNAYIKAVAGHYDLHWSTVKNIEKKCLHKKYKSTPLKDVQSMGIHEIHMGENLGEKGYLTIARDLDSGAILVVGKAQKGSRLDGF